MPDQLNMQVLLSGLCRHYQVPDIVALYGRQEFISAYGLQKLSSPGDSRESLTGKALYAMRFVSQPGVTAKAWCLEPNFIKYEFDGDAKKSLPTEVGVEVVTADGSQKFIGFGTFDGTKKHNEQAPPQGWIPGLARASPVTLENVTVTLDLGLGTQTVKLTKDSVAKAGGHNDPFPNGPTLENSIGKQAREEGWGAFKKDKKTGTIRGRFGDGDGDNKFAVLTFPSEPKEIRIFTSDEDRDEHVVQAECTDGAGNAVGLKLPYYEVLRRLGRPEGTPPEALAGVLAGGRVLVRGQGAVFVGKKPEDLGYKPEGWLQAVAQLTDSGVLAPVGSKSTMRRLHLTKMPARVDAQGNQLPPLDYIQVGDRKVYNIEEKKGDGTATTWELSTLCWDEKKKPWFSVKVSDKERGEGKLAWNYGGFFAFLGNLAASNLPDNDPMLAVVRQMALPNL